jgi:hypothetical protein
MGGGQVMPQLRCGSTAVLSLTPGDRQQYVQGWQQPRLQGQGQYIVQIPLARCHMSHLVGVQACLMCQVE